MSSIREDAKIDALNLSEAVFFEPGCFYPYDASREELLRSIIRDRAQDLGHPLTLQELTDLAHDLRDGKVTEARSQGDEFYARLIVRIAQCTIN